MVVDHFHDKDCRHLGLIYAAGSDPRRGIRVGHEYQPRGTAEIERVLAATIACEGMKTTRSAAHVSEGRRGGQDPQAPTEDLPLLGPEVARATLIVFASLCEPSIGPRNVNSLSTS